MEIPPCAGVGLGVALPEEAGVGVDATDPVGVAVGVDVRDGVVAVVAVAVTVAAGVDEEFATLTVDSCRSDNYVVELFSSARNV